jgi:glycosyltransferase-like protein
MTARRPLAAGAEGPTRPGRRDLSVGLYTYSTLPRGSVVHTAHLAEALADAGCDVTVYALDKDGRGFFRPLQGARLRLIPAAATPASTAELVRVRAHEMADYLERHAPRHDIDHGEDCLTTSGLLAARARGRRTTLVRTIHHVERFRDPFLAECQTRSIRQVDRLLTVSRTTAEEVARIFGSTAALVGNGVDVDRFVCLDAGRVAACRARLAGLAGHRNVQPGPVVLTVGGVEERKNTLALLGAFVRLRDTHPAAQLWIVGGATVLDHGAYRRGFEAARAALDPAAREAVIELGVVAEDDLPALYHLADVVALPSLQEGFGLAALEALAAGAPLVASDGPPFTEFLDAGCATLIDPRSEEAIARGLAAALASHTAVRRVRGRERARAHSWAAVAARHISEYERMLIHARDALLGSMA